APLQKGNAHGREIAVAYNVVVDVGVFVAVHVVLHPDAVVPSSLVEREEREACPANAGQCADAILDLLVDGVNPRVAGVIARRSRVNLKEKYAVAIKSCIYAREVDEAAQEESSASQQDQRKRYL